MLLYIDLDLLNVLLVMYLGVKFCYLNKDKINLFFNKVKK